MLGTTYGLQLLVALTFAIGDPEEGGCSSFCNQAGIMLVPIFGPVVISLDPPVTVPLEVDHFRVEDLCLRRLVSPCAWLRTPSV
jgi:hypothetical protein